MSIRPDVFVAVSSLGGGCFGLPLYWWSMNNTAKVTTQTETSITSSMDRTSVEEAQQEPTSTAKGECQIIDLYEEIEKFLEEKQKDKNIYVLFSCNNTNVKNSYIPLPSSWTGAFPTFFLTEQLSKKIGTKFVLTTNVQQEEGIFGSRMEATFSGTGLKSTVKGKWTGLEKEKIKTQLKDEVVSVEVGGGQGHNVIFLFLPQSSQTNEISS